MPYKVVEKKTRCGVNWMFFRCQYDGTPDFLEGLAFKAAHPEFFPYYHKGSIVKAAPGSIGILCFDEEFYAEHFRKILPGGWRTTIIKVEGIGEPQRNVKVIPLCEMQPQRLLRIYNCPHCPGIAPPEGTIAFPAVKVLE